MQESTEGGFSLELKNKTRERTPKQNTSYKQPKQSHPREK